MRRFLHGFALAATIAAVPMWALAGNQETAELIAKNLRTSGQMAGYKIGVKYQDGTAWLRGRVTSEEQMGAAMKLAFGTPGVSRVVNELTVAAPAQPAQNEPTQAQPNAGRDSQVTPRMELSDSNPLRDRDVPPAPQMVQQTKQKVRPTQQKAQRPEPISLAKRLESIVAGGSGQETPARADRLASSVSSAPTQPAPIQRVSAEEAQEEVPQQIAAPPRARPMNPPPQPRVAPQPRMAMNQMNARGPAAPNAAPMPMYTAAPGAGGVAPARYDQPAMPNYAWPSYASYPNYAAVTYPKQYSPTAWPYIGPFYPYPQVPMGWRKVTLEWDDGWWFLDFKDQPASCWHR